jgi:hypothetical protein
MKRPLHRLLRIRELVEDLALLDFEGKNAAMRALETSAKEQRQMALTLRSDAVRNLAGAPSTEGDAWLMSIADAEIAGWKEARLDALAEAEKPAVERAREELLTRRVERRQAEILRDSTAHAEEKRQILQEQNRTDDWFQSRLAERKSGR